MSWFWFELLAWLALISAGYVLSIYTWPKVREWLAGAAAEAEWLRNRARDIEARLRNKIEG